MEEPTAILKKYQRDFLRGRELQTDIEESVIYGQTSTIYVGRYHLWEDANAEIKSIENLRFPLNVEFNGEACSDVKGPRKEFFISALRFIATNMTEEIEESTKRKKRRQTI